MNSTLKFGSAETPHVYLCYGASGARKHTLSIAGDDASPWVGQKVCVIPVSGQSLPIACSPPVGEFQKLSPEEGCEWVVDCPVDGEDVEFDCLIKSEFTAAPHCIPMRMGHYLREFEDIKTHIPSPLINEEVEISIQVVSAYTKKKLKGVEVEWLVNGEFADSVDTTASGVSTFKHTFAVQGEHTITARVYNPYNATWTSHSFPVKVYESSPWKEAKLTVNGVVLPWASHVVLPHGQPSTVTVEVAPEIARELRLELVETNGLIIDVKPKDEWQVPAGGKFEWEVTPQAGEGGFVTMLFFSREVTQSWEHDCRVLSPNLADEFDVHYDGQPVSNDRNFFFRGDPRDITLVPKEDSAIAGLPIALTFEIKSNLDDDNLQCSPAFGEPTKVHSWKMAGSTKSGIFDLIFTCQGVSVPFVLPLNVLLSTDLNEEAEARLEGDVIAPGGTVLFRSEANRLTLVARPGSPFGHLPVSLQWARGTLTAEDFLCDPKLDENTKTHSWSITGPVGKSGTIGFKLVCEGMSTPLVLPECYVLSKNFDDEGMFTVDGVELTPDGTVLTRGVERTLTLVPKQDSPVGSLLKSLQWVNGEGLVKEDFTCAPVLDAETKLNSWKITGSATKSGRFRLKLVGPGMVPLVQLPACMLLSRNLEDDVTIKIDGADIPADGKVFIRGKPHTLTLEPKPGSLVADLLMSLRWGSGTGLGKEDFSYQPPLEQLIKPHSWTITGPTGKSGTFNLVVAGPGGITLITLAVMTLLSANLRDEADLLFAGKPVPAEGVLLLRGQPGSFSLQPKATSPIVGKLLAMTYAGGTLPESDLTCLPKFGEATTRHIWELTGAVAKSGTILAEVSYGQDAKLVMEPITVLSKIFSDEFSSITLSTDGPEVPVDLYGQGISLRSPKARLTLVAKSDSPIKGRTVKFKWAAGGNASVDIVPGSIVITNSVVVEFQGKEHPDSNKVHQLLVDYGGVETDSWKFKYVNSANLGPKVLFEGVEYGEVAINIELNKMYKLVVMPRSDDSAIIGEKCTFSVPATSGFTVQMVPSAGTDIEIKAPGVGGTEVNVRATKHGTITNPNFNLGMSVDNLSLRNIPMRVLDAGANE